jgi:VanZ family protein
MLVPSRYSNLHLKRTVNSASNSRRFPWREWAAGIVWLILIAIESTPWLSFQNTGHLLYQVVSSLLGSANASEISFVNAAMREVGHVTGYGVLSWLLFRAWRATLRSPDGPGWAISWSAVAFVMTAGVASLDEWHQTFLPSRTGSIHDVYLDSAAALIAQLLIFAFLRRRRSRREQAQPTVAVGD